MVVKQFTLICLFILLTGFGLSAQSVIKGNLKDTVNYKPMAYSAVALLRYQDSTMVKFVWVNDKDAFRFDNLQQDTYYLQITRPTFADYFEKIVLGMEVEKDLGTIVMISKSNLLKEVLIKEKSNAIRIKGDTTEFLVDSFLTNKNANVEDLLKKLPGIQVDKDGKIMAQGQEVKKVLVDGEEFFGEDPTVATRNLRADNVEKVQVFDKKSEQATFSGIDDGVKEKTINLQLKEDAKKGYFGKVSVGAGTDQRYENDAMVNMFKNKRKFSAYGAMSNTNKTRLSWDDANKFGGGNGDNYEVDDASGYMYFYSTGDNMNFDGVGIPQTWYTGVHYSDKVLGDRHNYALNITRKDLSTEGLDRNNTKYILPDTLYYVNQLKNVINQRMQTAMSGSYEWKVDSFSTLKFKLSIKEGQNISKVFTLADNLNENNELVNSNIRTNTYDTRNQNENSSLSWNRKFRTTGRSLTMQFNQTFTKNTGEEFVQSIVNLYDTSGAIFSSNVIDQKKVTNALTNTYSGKGTYTEPLSKYWFISGDYDVTATLSTSDRNTNAKQNGEYTLHVDSLSNNLDYDILVNKGGLAIRYVKKKLNISFGAKTSYTDMRQTEISTNKTFNQYFFNLFPSASFNYKPKTTANLNFGYNGSTRQPSVQQIQPIQDNSNPLDIYIGNPDLEQSFRNSFNFSYNTYKPISGQSFYTSAQFSFTEDDFTSFDQVDNYGRKTHKTVNVDGNSSFWGVAYYYFSIKKYHLRFGSNLNPYVSTNVNYINGLKNTNKSQRIGFGQNMSYELEKKAEFTVDADWTFNNGTSSLRPDVVTRYWLQTYTLYAKLFLPSKFELNADCAFNIRQKTSDFDNDVNVIMLNAGVSKKFLKSEALVAGISAYDLLNQNLGFDRNVSSNYINEHTYTVLKRYILFTLTWNFTKGAVEQDED